MADPLANVTWMTINNHLPEDEDLGREAEQFLGTLEEDLGRLDRVEEERLRELAVAAFR